MDREEEGRGKEKKEKEKNRMMEEVVVGKRKGFSRNKEDKKELGE